MKIRWVLSAVVYSSLLTDRQARALIQKLLRQKSLNWWIQVFSEKKLILVPEKKLKILEFFREINLTEIHQFETNWEKKKKLKTQKFPEKKSPKTYEISRPLQQEKKQENPGISTWKKKHRKPGNSVPYPHLGIQNSKSRQEIQLWVIVR